MRNTPIRTCEGAMDRDAVETWVADYERLWRTAGTD